MIGKIKDDKHVWLFNTTYIEVDSVLNALY
jgi:hypothetical protein